MIHGDAERSSDCILAAVALSNAVLVFVLAVEVVLEIVHYLLGNLGKAILLYQRQHGGLYWCQGCRYAQDNASLAVLQLLLVE